MQISQINFNGYIPLKKYKGPTLQLTPAEQARVDVLQENIVKLELSLYKVEKSLQVSHLPTQKFQSLMDSAYTLKTQINELRELIKEIKRQRFAIQKGNSTLL